MRHPFVGQRRTLRRQAYHPAARQARLTLLRLRRRNRLFQRPRLHDHARPATEGAIIDPTPGILGKIPRIPALPRPALFFQRPAGYTALRHRRKHLRENGNAVEPDHQSLPHATRIRPASPSTA